MGDDLSCSASDVLALPAEIRTLVDFLQTDDRPTAILHLQNDVVVNGTGHFDAVPQIIYQNPTLEKLEHAEEDLASLREQLRQACGQEKREQLHGKETADRRWSLRVSRDYCIAVRASESLQDSTHNGTSPVELHAGEESQDQFNADSLSDDESSQDWTRSAIRGMSPWIEFIRSWNWSVTDLGPMESWSPVLRANMRSMMSNPNPRLIVWGKDSAFVYNEACVPFWGKRHPDCLGGHLSKHWEEAWPYIKPMIDEVFRGEVKQHKGWPLLIDRNGFLESTYWNFTMIPLLDLNGKVVGIFDELTESTMAVTGERRRGMISNLSKHIDTARSLSELWTGVLSELDTAHCDIAYAALYSVSAVDTAVNANDSKAPKECVLFGTVGLPEGHLDHLHRFPLDAKNDAYADGLVQGCYRAWQKRQPVILKTEDGSLPKSLAIAIDGRGFDAQVEKVLVSPVRLTISKEVPGIIVVGLNSRSAYSGEYELFMHVTMDIIEKAAALISLPEEQRRAQKVSDDIHNALTKQLRLTTLKAERSEAKFTRLAATAPTGMFMFDAEGVPLYINDTYLEMLGLTKEEAMAKRPDPRYWEDIVHEDDLQHFVGSWARISDRKVPATVEYRLKKPWKSVDKSTGQELSGQTWLLATAFPEIEANGSVTTVQGWITDISHRKFTESLLSQRLEDALENKRQTENFIDMTSHEMRNPLSAILQSADSVVSTLTAAGMPHSSRGLTLSPDTTDEILDAAQTIILCAQHQKRIVDDILTLSKLDASLLVISPDKVQIPPLITKALKMYEAEIERAEISTQLIVEPSYQSLEIDWVILDPSRLLQVIINLLTNSVKFTQHSETRKITICLGASHVPPTGKHHGVSFATPRHFRPQRSMTPPELPGSEDIYLQIAVYDTGRGLTEEELAMLFQRFQQASPKTYSQYGGSGLGLFISRELCELQGGQIGAASGGGSTVFTFYVKAKRYIQEQKHFKENLEVASRSLKRFPSFTSTAASPVAFGRRGSTAMDGVSDQQVYDENLASVAVLNASKPHNIPGGNVIENSANGDHPIHVLIVEDNLINQKVMSQQLRRAGCTVHVANHGAECLEFLEQTVFCAAQIPLSIILLDLEMPTMNGLACIRQIRDRQMKGEIIRHVPVIAVTANARSEQINIAIDAGMDSVVTKPFRIPELIPQMERLIADLSQVKLGTIH